MGKIRSVISRCLALKHLFSIFPCYATIICPNFLLSLKPLDAMGISLIAIYKFLWTYGGSGHVYICPWLENLPPPLFLLFDLSTTIATVGKQSVPT